ncbi:MAG: type II secretion system protein [Patescibacteria group bacterium]|nr:type II secretion system protein [Patescibacteria group bacterium]
MRKFRSQFGFTLMEILVAAAIFGTVVSALSAMFNYTLKINRRSQALRQATQDMRDFVEFLAKEVRNGRIDYAMVDSGSTAGQVANSQNYPLGPCPQGSVAAGPAVSNYYQQGGDNKLAVQTTEGNYECFYLAFGPGNSGGNTVGSYVNDNNQFAAQAGVNPNPVLAMKKSTISNTEILSPANASVQYLKFIVRPLCDPYSQYCAGGYPDTQPTVTIIADFLLKLPTGEKTEIRYQTSVSTNQYDIPH